jgi:hypothetical protein
MTEEVVPEGTPEQTPAAAPAPFEAKAIEMGWRPKEEWDGPEEEFIDAKEFVRRQPLFEKIESQSKAIKQLAQAFDALKTHHTKVKETEYQRALTSLKAAKREALRDGETDRALAYEEKIDEVEQQKAEFDAEAQKVQVPQEPQAHPDFVAWKQKNNWYSKDSELREFADSYGTTLARKGLAPGEVLDAVAKQVRKAFPEKFTNPNRERAGSVEPPTRTGASQTGFSLSEDERTIMKKIVRTGVMTEADYIKDIKRMRGL